MTKITTAVRTHEATAHTPGPWHISKTGRLPIYVAAKDGRWKDSPGTLLAQIGGDILYGTGNFQESLANAKLIAAAPGMLDALRQWAWAEQMGDEQELENARLSRNAAIEAALDVSRETSKP